MSEYEKIGVRIFIILQICTYTLLLVLIFILEKERLLKSIEYEQKREETLEKKRLGLLVF